MSTHCMIGIANPDGTVDAIYCHFDGYIDGVGTTLVRHYRDEAKVRALIALGDLSSLGAEIGEAHDFDYCPDGVCNAYGRDRGEDDVAAHRASSVENFREDRNWGGEYFYLWRDGAWEATNYRGDRLMLPA